MFLCIVLCIYLVYIMIKLFIIDLKSPFGIMTFLNNLKYIRNSFIFTKYFFNYNFIYLLLLCANITYFHNLYTNIIITFLEMYRMYLKV